MRFICDCAGLQFKTVAALIRHVEKEHCQPKAQARRKEGSDEPNRNRF